LSIFFFPQNIISITFFNKEYYDQTLTKTANRMTRDVERRQRCDDESSSDDIFYKKDGVVTFRRSIYYDRIADLEAYNSTCITVLQAPRVQRLDFP
jgi:hypothetical protein